MGGSSKKKTTSTPAEKDISNAAIRPMTEVPAAMPGQLDALSQQLAMGYGQQPADLLSLMNQYYQPMMLPDYGPNAGPVSPSEKDKSNAKGSLFDQLGDFQNNKVLVQDASTGAIVGVPRR